MVLLNVKKVKKGGFVLCPLLTVGADKGLVPPVERTAGLGCIPVGRTVSYECTVTDDTSGFSTIWQGSALNCRSSSNVITLSHSINGVSGTCGNLSAMNVEVSGNNYTSRLTITATAGLNGMTVECTLNSLLDFGNDTLKTGGNLIQSRE